MFCLIYDSFSRMTRDEVSVLYARCNSVELDYICYDVTLALHFISNSCKSYLRAKYSKSPGSRVALHWYISCFSSEYENKFFNFSLGGQRFFFWKIGQNLFKFLLVLLAPKRASGNPRRNVSARRREETLSHTRTHGVFRLEEDRIL